MSKKYQVVNQPVEINGKTYPVGSVVDEAAFAPAPEVSTPEEKQEEKQKVEEVQEINQAEDVEPVAELQSLLKTGHVVPVEK